MNPLEIKILTEDGKEVKLGEIIKGKWTVLYFYPKDNTPGCTIEGKEFSELLGNFESLGVMVYGVSRDSPSSHKRFKEKQGITVPLLSDPDGTLHKALGAWGRKIGGKEGAIRSTFIFDPEGRVVWSMKSVKPRGHAKEVLEVAKKLIASGKNSS
ncbi:MAG: peroxiredoxin [Fervidicoccaceae archaeon]